MSSLLVLALLIMSTLKVDNFLIQEINEHRLSIPYILLGLKSDLRDNQQKGMILTSF
jgi:GTPase SAR1 family protein